MEASQIKISILNKLALVITKMALIVIMVFSIVALFFVGSGLVKANKPLEIITQEGSLKR